MSNEEFSGQDDQTRRIIKKAGIAEPSADFTDRLMQKIEALPTPEVFVYKPLISKRTWIISGFIFGLFCLYMIFFPSTDGAELAGYMMRVEIFNESMDHLTDGFLDKLFAIPSIKAISALVAAGWILFGADKLLRKLI